jgi:L-asparaginase II
MDVSDIAVDIVRRVEGQPIRVQVRRGGVVEAVHLVHAVAVRDGAIVAAAGDPERVQFLRSSLKPLQAIPLVEAYDDLTDAEVAIASASHRAEPAQLEAVRTLLARSGSTEDDLENGEQEGRPPGRIHHNCSGKHAGMLAACRANGWETRGYRLPEHPLQRRIAAELGAAAVASAVDGCGVPTYATTLRDAAALLLGAPERVRTAMRARPELVGGDGASDTELMRTLDGWIAKAGAEGLLCAAGPDGLGVALKCEDGNSRATGPAAAAFLGGLGYPLPALERTPLVNSRGERVGEIAALTRAE